MDIESLICNEKTSLILEPDGAAGQLRWRSDNHDIILDLDRDVLGFDIKNDNKLVVKSFVISQEKKACYLTERTRVRKDFVFQMETHEIAAQWGQLLSDNISRLGRPKHLFVIVNPFGGKRSAPKIFETEVRPLLEAAGVHFTMQESEYMLHAKEIAYSLDLTKYDGIVCVSGDGVLVEVVNGLLKREDWAKAIKLPLGVIPAGTGNGMAKSLLHSVGDLYSPSNATFAIIRGNKRSLDVASAVQGTKRFFSVLLLTWGLAADIDIESEKYRWMGIARFDFYSVVRIMDLRKYNGKIQFVPANGYEKYGDPIKDIIEFEKQNLKNSESEYKGYRGASTEFELSEWRYIEGPFVMVWLNNVPWPNKDMMIAPKAQFSDGCLDLLVIGGDCPKMALLSLMLKTKDGSHVDSPYVKYLKIKAFKMEAGGVVGNEEQSLGIIDMDGEVIARAENNNEDPNLMNYEHAFQMSVDQGLATIFCPN